MRYPLNSPWHARLSARGGFTLVEVLIATAILTALAIGVMATLTFASHVSRINTNAVAAKNIAQGFFEQMAIDEFANVDAEHYPNLDYDSDPPVYLDRAMNIRCRVTFQFKGFGTLTNASASELTDNDADWVKDEWNGDTVFIVSGPGAGQFGIISMTTPKTLHLTKAMDVAPRKDAKYLINNGKTVEITTTWQYRGREYSATVESLVINYRNSEDFGF